MLRLAPPATTACHKSIGKSNILICDVHNKLSVIKIATSKKMLFIFNLQNINFVLFILHIDYNN